MHNTNSFNSFTTNILKLKNYVNKNYQGDNKNEILLVIFNAVTSYYPDRNWLLILDNFFQNIPHEDIELTMYYTIISYKLGPTFTNRDSLIQTDLINTLIHYNVNSYKIHKYASILLEPKLLELTNYAYNNHLIKPRHIYKIILDNFILDKMDEIKLDEIVEKVNLFIKEHEMKIFNGNYFFFNIYQCLKRLVTLDFYPEDTSAIELIPLFNTILNEDIKMQIQKDFQRIEESNKPLIEKIKDAITIAHHYGYELPIAQEKKLSKKALNNQLKELK